MKKNSIGLYFLALLIFFFIAACNKNGDNTTYTCTCNYKNLATGKDTVLKRTYPSGTSQTAAKTNCDSNTTTIKVIDPAGTCSL